MNKLHKLVIETTNSEVMNFMEGDDREIFMVKLESYKSWTNGFEKEYIEAFRWLEGEVSAISVRKIKTLTDK